MQIIYTSPQTMNCAVCRRDAVRSAYWVFCASCHIEMQVCYQCVNQHANNTICATCNDVSRKSAELIIRGLAYVHINGDDPENLIERIIQQLESTGNDFRYADLDFAKAVGDLRTGRQGEPTKLRRIKGK